MQYVEFSYTHVGIFPYFGKGFFILYKESKKIEK